MGDDSVSETTAHLLKESRKLIEELTERLADDEGSVVLEPDDDGGEPA
jgi:predicted P-loop ATPase/GTPase